MKNNNNILYKVNRIPTELIREKPSQFQKFKKFNQWKVRKNNLRCILNLLNENDEILTNTV